MDGQGYPEPMARAPRGPSGLILLALVVVALTAVALVPRGVVRTVVTSQLVRAGEPDLPAGVNDGSPRQVHLPGVRAMLSREERDDPAAAVVEHLLAVQVSVSTPHQADDLHQRTPLTTARSTPADGRLPSGRGPPPRV